MYISKKVFVVVLTATFITAAVITALILNHNPSGDYIIITKDMFNDKTVLDNNQKHDNLFYYEWKDVLNYDQDRIDSYLDVKELDYDEVVKIAEDMVFSKRKNEVSRPYYVYYDENNGAYMVLSWFQDRGSFLKVVIDKSTGGVLCVFLMLSK